MSLTIEQIVSTFDRVLRTTPDYRFDYSIIDHLLGGPAVSYGARLVRRRYNRYGELIPQSTIVRGNLARLGRSSHCRVPD